MDRRKEEKVIKEVEAPRPVAYAFLLRVTNSKQLGISSQQRRQFAQNVHLFGPQPMLVVRMRLAAWRTAASAVLWRLAMGMAARIMTFLNICQIIESQPTSADFSQQLIKDCGSPNTRVIRRTQFSRYALLVHARNKRIGYLGFFGFGRSHRFHVSGFNELGCHIKKTI